MARSNGAEAMFLLGSLHEAVKGIRVDVADIKSEVRTELSAVKADVASIKANQRPRRRLRVPPWLLVRFAIAAGFTLAAAAMKIDPGWVKQVLSSMR
jgi:hypothetical protein